MVGVSVGQDAAVDVLLGDLKLSEGCCFGVFFGVTYTSTMKHGRFAYGLD